MERRYSLILALVFTILILPFTSSAEASFFAGTQFNATTSNASMTFLGCAIDVDSQQTTELAITLYNPVYNDPNLAAQYVLTNPINWTTPNQNIDCSAFATTYGHPNTNPPVNTTASAATICSAFSLGLTNFYKPTGFFFLILGAIVILVIVFFLVRQVNDVAEGETGRSNFGLDLAYGGATPEIGEEMGLSTVTLFVIGLLVLTVIVIGALFILNSVCGIV